MPKFILLFLLSSVATLAQIPTPIQIPIADKKFTIYTNATQEDLGKYEKAIITIHGSTRNADTYFKTFYSLAKKNNLLDKVLIIAPHFKLSGSESVKDELVYSYEGWWIGDPSLMAGISSFTVIDEIIKLVSNDSYFPNMKSIFVTGHSAGGHLTSRLALGTVVDNNLTEDITYVVANPGTYAYISDKRPVGVNTGVYEKPSRVLCQYDNYKYGMQNRNPYMNRDDVKNMVDRFIKRKVIYLLGEKDTGDVEHNCASDLQGPHRYARGLNYKGHIDDERPDNIHELITVPEIGHTQWGMYNSSEGKRLFLDL